MRVTIRQGVFETNSSSSHSLTIMTIADFERWRKGELYLNNAEDDTTKLPLLCTLGEALEWMRCRNFNLIHVDYADDMDTFLGHRGIYSFGKWFISGMQDITIRKDVEKVTGFGPSEGTVTIEYDGYDWGTL